MNHRRMTDHLNQNDQNQHVSDVVKPDGVVNVHYDGGTHIGIESSGSTSTDGIWPFGSNGSEDGVNIMDLVKKYKNYILLGVIVLIIIIASIFK